MLWKQILTYLDDLNVLGTSFKDHLGNLIQSFDCLRKYNFKLKPHKCIFFQKEVPFLGKLATTKGIGVDPKKTGAIINWPPPTDRREVESFLGLANYHQNHNKEYAKLACPLYELTSPKPPSTGIPLTKRPLRLSKMPWSLPLFWPTQTVLICSYWTRMHLILPLGLNSSNFKRGSRE